VGPAGTIANRAYAPKPGAPARPAIVREACQQLAGGENSTGETLLTQNRKHYQSSISTLEAFNDVRNNRSLAHDNKILDYDEALLIFNHVASSIRFLRSMETRIQREPATFSDNDLPF